MKNIADLFLFLRSTTWKAIKWITRPVNLIMKAGLSLCLIGFSGANWASFSATYLSENGTASFIKVVSNENNPFIAKIMVGIGIIGLLMVIGETIYIINRRRRILNVAIEHIALREKIASPLISYVSKESGRSDTLPIDLTRCYSGFVVTSPQKALDLTVLNISETLLAQIKQAGTKDVTVHYGGTAPVGLGFLAGFLLGNTSKMIIWDYNRDLGEWYKLGGFVDSNQPYIDREHYQPAEEICLILEISHPVAIEDVQKKVLEMPYIKVSMPNIKYDNMSSKEKVETFQLEFREILKSLNADGVKTVHIFCAAQASFNFCMGRQVTKNHPVCIVYEYLNSSIEKYPWGILFNTKNDNSPVIV